MTYLLIGGSKSGKSHLAQQLCRSLGGPLVYWATMEPVDGEDRARIENHLRDREGWGFETLEAARDLPAAFDRLPADATVLFDSATALLANEMFRPDGTMDKDAGARSAQELLALARSCRHLVCVCDDLWRDGQDYDPWTRTALWASTQPPTSTMSGGMSSTGDTKVMCWWTAFPGCRSTS